MVELLLDNNGKTTIHDISNEDENLWKEIHRSDYEDGVDALARFMQEAMAVNANCLFTAVDLCLRSMNQIIRIKGKHRNTVILFKT